MLDEVVIVLAREVVNDLGKSEKAISKAGTGASARVIGSDVLVVTPRERVLRRLAWRSPLASRTVGIPHSVQMVTVTVHGAAGGRTAEVARGVRGPGVGLRRQLDEPSRVACSSRSALYWATVAYTPGAGAPVGIAAIVMVCCHV